MIKLEAQPCHLCSFGNLFANELNQCQHPGYKWIELLPGIFVCFCEKHYMQVLPIASYTERDKTIMGHTK